MLHNGSFLYLCLKEFSKKQKKCKETVVFISKNIAFPYLPILEFRKGLEEKSNLLKERRESPSGERRPRRADEHGLGAASSI